MKKLCRNTSIDSLKWEIITALTVPNGPLCLLTAQDFIHDNLCSDAVGEGVNSYALDPQKLARLIRDYLLGGNIIIRVEGGVVTDVTGLPEGWSYQLEDMDLPENGQCPHGCGDLEDEVCPYCGWSEEDEDE